ncbi:MAG: ABC transporter substrate-binding protein [Acidimicrobiia bacterium]|nr:ABC transporter substrate-binding protein [Acidimicrobiia bacterium]MCL4293211.1 ABC transporter substrate-binding protein [Acidimicrobiia bacterium]
MEPTRKGSKGPRSRALRRYGPIAVVVVIAVAVIAVVGRDDGGKSDSGRAPKAAATGDALIRSGPMTPAKAKLLRRTVDFGPGCDTETGRVKVPAVYAPPCVEPFTGDNGGATAPGVTADTIEVVAYLMPPELDPLQTALLSKTGADLGVKGLRETYERYAEYFGEHFETYGRKVNLRFYTATGSPSDVAKAKADALAIAGMDPKPFAVLGGPTQAPEFSDQLAAEKILCLGGCSLATPERFSAERQPYLWGNGPSPEQGARLAAEMIGKLFRGRAEHAGDPAFRSRERVYGVLHLDSPDGRQRKLFETLRDDLADRGVKLTTDVEYFLDVPRAQENARTAISKLKAAGVTTVIFYGDPLMPIYFTKEATAQGYFPEWIIGPTVYVDTTVFGRQYDQRQWAHAFGLSEPAARLTPEHGEAYRVYKWQFGTEPPSNLYAMVYSDPEILFTGIHLAGPKLTPETFRDGLFRYPVTGGGPTTPLLSRGRHGIWPGVDLFGSDDITVIWWDPDATGPNEMGEEGRGMYRYADRGRRYRWGRIPDRIPGLFDPATSVTVFDEPPPGSAPPDYPPPDRG